MRWGRGKRVYMPKHRSTDSIGRCGTEREIGGRFKREGTYVYLWMIHAEV